MERRLDGRGSHRSRGRQLLGHRHRRQWLHRQPGGDGHPAAGGPGPVCNPDAGGLLRRRDRRDQPVGQRRHHAVHLQLVERTDDRGHLRARGRHLHGHRHRRQQLRRDPAGDDHAADGRPGAVGDPDARGLLRRCDRRDQPVGERRHLAVYLQLVEWADDRGPEWPDGRDLHRHGDRRQQLRRDPAGDDQPASGGPGAVGDPDAGGLLRRRDRRDQPVGERRHHAVHLQLVERRDHRGHLRPRGRHLHGHRDRRQQLRRDPAGDDHAADGRPGPVGDPDAGGLLRRCDRRDQPVGQRRHHAVHLQLDERRDHRGHLRPRGRHLHGHRDRRQQLRRDPAGDDHAADGRPGAVGDPDAGGLLRRRDRRDQPVGERRHHAVHLQLDERRDHRGHLRARGRHLHGHRHRRQQLRRDPAGDDHAAAGGPGAVRNPDAGGLLRRRDRRDQPVGERRHCRIPTAGRMGRRPRT